MKRRKTNPIGIPHTKSQWLALVLALLFVVTLPPLSPLSAQTDGEEASSGETLSGEDLSGERDAFTYTEIVDQREPFVKYFERSDGRYTAVVYPEAVHTEVDGEMVNIDNRLVYRADKRLYQTSNPTFRASFSQSAGEEDAVSVTFEGYTLSWRVETVQKPLLPAGRKTVAALAESLEAVTAVRASKESLASLTAVDFVDADRKKTFTAEEINSTFAAVAGIRYADAFGSETKIDLSYTIAADRLEEDIVLREKGGADAFVLHMTAPGLTASLEEDRSLVFSDGMGKTIFTVGAPWMYDAAGEVSEAVTVTLAQREDEVTVVYTPDAVWLKAAEREYPVVLDPSVKSRRYTSNYEDTYVISGTAAANRSGLQYTVAGLSADGKAYDTYTRIKGLPKILDAMDVTSVTMNYYSPKNGADLRMKLLDQSWNAATIEYASAPKGTGTAYTPVITSESGRWRYSFDFYNAVKEYGRTHTSMEGFFTGFLKGFRLYGTTAVSSPPRLDSAESASTGFRPFVEIVYTYKHDIPVISGGVYSLKNAASGKYLTVSASDDNAYQYEKTGTNTQAFTLIGGNGCFTIRPVSRSGKALGYEYSADTTGVTNGNNVMAKPYSAANADKEEFIIQYVDTIGGYDYYALISRADTSMALSVVGNSNGSMSGTGSSSPGNAYMYAYTGASSQLWTLESGGQPVFIGNSIVEENGSLREYTLGIGASMVQPYCAVTSFGDTITWSSSDSTAIAIAANGEITIKNAGDVTLTATVKSSSGSVKNTYSYRVILQLENGVYYIRNQSTGKYLDAAGTSFSDGTNVVQSTKSTSGKERFGQLWKVYYIGNGCYSIRPLRKLNMGLDVTGTNVDIYSIGTNDTQTGVPSYAKWTLKSSNDYGYRIRNNALDSKTLSLSGDNVCVAEYAGYVNQFWRFERVTITPGIYLYQTTDGVALEESVQFFAAPYSETELDQTVTWSSSDSEVLSVDQDGWVTSKKTGVATITAKKGSVTNSMTVMSNFSAYVTETEKPEYIINALNTPHNVWPAEEGTKYDDYTNEGRFEELLKIYTRALTLATGGELAFSNAAALLDHFLDCSGTLYTVDFTEMLNDNDTIKQNRSNDLNIVMRIIEKISDNAPTGTIRTMKVIPHEYTGSSFTDWKLSINDYSVGFEITYNRTGNAYSASVSYQLYDVYDWEPTSGQDFGIFSEQELWELHYGGAAKFFEVTGVNLFDLTWTRGETMSSGAEIQNEQ